MAIQFLNNSTKIKGQEKNVIPSTSKQTIIPDEGYNALTSVTVNAVTASIDSNIQAQNIKKDVSILGITGTLESALEIEPTNTFTDDTAKQFYDIQAAYDAMSPRVITDTNKTIDKNIYVIPTKSDGTPLLDCSQLTAGSELFTGCTKLKSIPKLDFSNVSWLVAAFQNCENLESVGDITSTADSVYMAMLFTGCKKLKRVPKITVNGVNSATQMFHRCERLEKLPELDLSTVPSITDFASGCTNLKDVPVYNLSSLSSYGLGSVFSDCPNLTDQSLNNILASITTAPENIKNRTLKKIGLSPAQATKCTTLSNWAACAAAGWTTGY